MPKKFASMNDEQAENAFSTSPRMRHIYELFVEAQDGATHSKKRAAIRALMEEVFTIEEQRLQLAIQVDEEKKKFIDLLAKLDRTEQELINKPKPLPVELPPSPLRDLVNQEPPLRIQRRLGPVEWAWGWLKGIAKGKN